MLKTMCKCDRCGKEILETDAKTVIITGSMAARWSQRDNKFPIGYQSPVSPFASLINSLSRLSRPNLKDYCPDCIAAISEFIKGGDSEND